MDSVEVIGLPLGRGKGSSIRGAVVQGDLPSTTTNHTVGAPLHALREVALPARSEADVLIGFDPIAVVHGRKSGAQLSVLWGIDFVPTRGNKLLDITFRHLERRAMQRIALQIENTERALAARQKASGVIPRHSAVVPITLDLSIFPGNDPVDRNLRLVYLGGLNERTGADRLLPIMEELRSLGVRATLDIIGSGPLLESIRRDIYSRHLTDRVVLHGFVEGDNKVVDILSRCSVGLAPFSASTNDFTWFTDPQKVKFYVGAGLCVVMTNANSVASSIEREGAGIVLPPEASARMWAQKLLELSQSYDRLRQFQRQSRRFAHTFERVTSYEIVLEKMLRALG